MKQGQIVKHPLVWNEERECWIEDKPSRARAARAALTYGPGFCVYRYAAPSAYPKSSRLHREGCRAIQGPAEAYERFSTVEEALAAFRSWGCSGELPTCRKCLPTV